MRAHATALAAALAASTGIAACTPQGAQLYTIDVPLGLAINAPIPDGSTITEERVELGERLFRDPLLSADRTISCSSCHRPDHQFADDEAISPGVYGRKGHRNTPSLLNIAYARQLTWDGRSATLEEQVLKPIQDPVEMDLTLGTLLARLSSSDTYRTAFEQAFGGPVTSERVALALAAYLRTLRSGDAAIDRTIVGDANALPTEERMGFRLFVGKAGCSFCHTGPLFSDGEFHNTGVTARSGSTDQGRFTRTGVDADHRAFRTASLRNVAATAPYMHDGSITTLEEVVDFYDRGGGPDPLLDEKIRPLRLTDHEKRALLAYLRTLGNG